MNTTRAPRSAWNNTRHWPIAHRSQSDAGLPAGPIADDEPVTNRQRFYLGLGLLMGLLVFGPALADLWSVL